MGPGGKERRLTELMKILPSHHIDFELVVMSNDFHYKEVFNLGIPIHYLIRKAKKDISIFGKFYSICKKFNPNIIHCWDSMTAIYSIPASLLLNITLINGMITDIQTKKGYFNQFYLRSKFSFFFSKLIIGNSYAGLASYDTPKYKSKCIHNGFNFDRVKIEFHDQLIRSYLNISTKYIVGMVASFSNLKDYKTYLSAAVSVLKERSDITFLSIGSGTDTIECSNLIDNNYSDNFRFLGKQQGIESLTHAMDVCVLASFSEGISNSILEYMALGKPVIATNAGGTNEIIIDKITGFLINTSDTDALAEKIKILLNDDLLRKEMGQAGEKRIQESFSIKKMVDEYISVYAELKK